MSIPLLEMAAIIPKSPVNVSPSNSKDSLLLPFLCLNSKITYMHDGQHHKGYLSIKDGVRWFIFKFHFNKCKEDWDTPLPNLPMTWVDMCVKGILIPGHVPHTFLWSSASPRQSTFDPIALLVSTVNLHWEHPPTLLWALADSHPDCAVCLQSNYEEKQGIKSLGTFRKSPLGNIRRFMKKVRQRQSLLCGLTIKKDENLLHLPSNIQNCHLGQSQGQNLE
jgi:hypothetical protein